MSDQVWLVPVTPAQRWELLRLSHAEGQKLVGRKGRMFRRFMRAFGIDVIRSVLVEHDNRYNAAIHRAHTPALHELTVENIEYALGLEEVEHTPQQEMILGPLWELIEEAKKAGAYEPPEGVPPFDATTEDWAPKEALADPVEEAARKITAHLRAAGHGQAAELVERGGWDQEPAPNGAKAASAPAGPAADAS